MSIPTLAKAVVSNKLLILFCLHIDVEVFEGRRKGRDGDDAYISLTINGPDLLHGPKASFPQNLAQRQFTQDELGNELDFFFREDFRLSF